MAERAALRKLEDLSIGPVLTWTTDAMLAHVDKLLQIPGGHLPCFLSLEDPRLEICILLGNFFLATSDFERVGKFCKSLSILQPSCCVL